MQQQRRQKVICRTAEPACGQKYFQSQLVGTNLDELSQIQTPNHKYTLGMSHIQIGLTKTAPSLDKSY